MAKHVQKCKMRADVMAEHEALLELRKIEGPRPKPLPDWPKCKNCGEPYGPHAIGPHEARCCKLLPHGANGFGPQDHAKDPKFKHLYKASNIGVEERANEGLAEQAARSLSDLGKSMGSLLAYLGPSMTQAELDRLRKLFDRFDSAPKDSSLDMEEYAMLMRNVFPTRVADAESIVAMFKEADVDGSGHIDFPEFARMYVEMRDTEIDPRFEEACRMFDFFDADKSGELDPDEFLCLLNQVFPEYCEENEARAVEQFEEADLDGSGGISFAEFIAFYDILKRIYDNYDKGPSAEELAAIEAEEEARRLAELDAALIQCKCGLSFLPSVLPQHQRSCEACAPKKKEVAFADDENKKKKGRRKSVEFADNDSNSFVACEWCARTFFPDRLPVHYRVCKARLEAEGGGGIRATMTDGKHVTMGLYRSMKSGKWSKSGRIAAGARPDGAAKDDKLYLSPAKAAQVAAKEGADKKAKDCGPV